MTPRRVYLLGFMGAGKTTVGRMLADQLDWPFVDLDDRIEREAGTSIPRYFRTKGEASFRQLELKCLDRVSRKDPPVIVACGGGVPLSSRNRRILEETGLPVVLTVTPEIAVQRVGDDPNRPLFDDPDQVRRLWEQRRPAYRALPHSVPGDRDPDQVAQAIYELMSDS